MKILVTGSSGLVGQAIQKLSHGYENSNWIFVSSKDADLLDFNETKTLFNLHNPNIVIHLAAYVGGLFKNLNNNLEMFEKNILINLNVIRCCHLYNVNKAIFCLSTCIFPNLVTYPINEEQLHNGVPHESNYGYSYSKRMLEVHCRLYNQKYNRQYICISPTNIYGKYDNFSLQDSHVVPGLIHQCYLAQKNNRPFIIKGSGKPLRQFLYSEDLAQIIINITFDSILESNIIVAPSKEISINELGSIISKIFNYNVIEYDKNYLDGQYKKTVDNKLLLKLYPNTKFTSINDGLKDTISWFIKNYNCVRK